jgi:hypothetical protein
MKINRSATGEPPRQLMAMADLSERIPPKIPQPSPGARPPMVPLSR